MSIIRNAISVAEEEAEDWMRSVTGRRRVVPQHEVPNMVRGIIIAYLTHVSLNAVRAALGEKE